jgi:hypothetical protein
MAELTQRERDYATMTKLAFVIKYGFIFNIYGDYTAPPEYSSCEVFEQYLRESSLIPLEPTWLEWLSANEPIYRQQIRNEVRKEHPSLSDDECDVWWSLTR